MTVPSDDDLRRRVCELGRRESGSAPEIETVLRPGRRPEPEPTARPAPWLRLAALAGAAALLAVAWWWPPTERPSPRAVASVPAPPGEREPAMEWALPTDALLEEPSAERDGGDVERLSREIERLLRP
jgi:hypothetical protein